MQYFLIGFESKKTEKVDPSAHNREVLLCFPQFQNDLSKSILPVAGVGWSFGTD